MKLIDLEVNKYLDVLKSNAPAPGGGSVSALAGAQGAALFMMVADLTLGKEKFAEFEDVCKAAKQKGAPIYEALVAAVDKDTEAFNMVAAAFKMPKDTDEAKAARSRAIAEATMTATEVPFHSMELAFEGLKIAETMIGRSNPNAASDLGVAILNLMACIRGAWLNVKINLPGLKDEAARVFFEIEGTRIMAEAENMAKRLYDKILCSL